MTVSEKDRRHFAIIGEGMRQKEEDRRMLAASRDPGDNATRMLERSDFWLCEILSSRVPSDWPLIDPEEDVLEQADLQRAWIARNRGSGQR